MRIVLRSKLNRVIAGVCGGLAESYNTDPLLIRLGFVFLGIITGVAPLLIVYVIFWLARPYGRNT